MTHIRPGDNGGATRVLGPDDAVSPAGVLRWEDPRPAEWLAWALDHIAGRPLPPPQAAGSNAQAGRAAIPGVLKLGCGRDSARLSLAWLGEATNFSFRSLAQRR
jgi:hypothetical protein